MKLDEKTVVPIGLVFVVCGILIKAAITGTNLISTINFRFQRIEDKLGIPRYKDDESSIDLIKKSYAEDKRK